MGDASSALHCNVPVLMWCGCRTSFSVVITSCNPRPLAPPAQALAANASALVCALECVKLLAHNQWLAHAVANHPALPPALDAVLREEHYYQVRPGGDDGSNTFSASEPERIGKLAGLACSPHSTNYDTAPGFVHCNRGACDANSEAAFGFSAAGQHRAAQCRQPGGAAPRRPARA